MVLGQQAEKKLIMMIKLENIKVSKMIIIPKMMKILKIDNFKS
jgi:hypothetical protein